MHISYVNPKVMPPPQILIAVTQKKKMKCEGISYEKSTKQKRKQQERKRQTKELQD